MAVDIGGLVAILAFYSVILIIGIWAARKTGFNAKNLKIEDVIMANHSLGMFVGVFTMTATWVGGGYINGTAEVVFSSGLVWCQAPLGYALSLIFGGIFFVNKMRSCGFVTMLDPFHWKYGKLMSCLLYFPALTGDVFWSASILSALGATLKVVLGISLETSIIISAAIAVVYTLLGGLYSVAYTDVIQLILMFIGLWLCVPFSMTHDATFAITTNSSSYWMGNLEVGSVAEYMDYWLLLICGGIPWQVYWQRALAAKSMWVAQSLSFLGAFGCVFMAVPALLIGAIAKSTDWNQTDYGYFEIRKDDYSLTLPLVMKYLCPPAVTFIGLGAVSAAVMSSTDSSILSSSSMFGRNVFGVLYSVITKKKPSETLLVWVMRFSQIIIGVFACAMAITVKSVYHLFVLCGDLVYVLLFPQLVCVMYMRKSNAYGSLSGFLLGLIFRLLGGETKIGLPATLEYPWYDSAEGTQLFPYRTLCMLICMITIISVSLLTDYLFRNEILPLSADIYSCFQYLRKDAPAQEIKESERVQVQESEISIHRSKTERRRPDYNN